MTGVDVPLERSPRPPARGPRLRLPASRGGLVWLSVLLLIGTLLAVQVGRQVYANYAITERAAALRAEIAAMETGNKALQAQIDYLTSDAFVAAEARRLQNLGHPGEQLLIIPPGAEAPLPAALTPAPPTAKPRLEQWLELFFGI
jgi:cell division protein FtsB